MLSRLKTRLQAGDTIVEVMIVLAVLGLAISICYATANRSLTAARAAQENSQATAELQSQIEGLRVLAKSSTDNIYVAGPYCIKNLKVVLGTCNVDSLYTVSVKHSIVGAGGVNIDEFALEADYPDAQGLGTDHVFMKYRVYND